MPQMMPMNWMMMFMFLLSIMLTIMIITYTIKKQLPNKEKMTFNTQHQWTW